MRLPVNSVLTALLHHSGTLQADGACSARHTGLSSAAAVNMMDAPARARRWPASCWACCHWARSRTASAAARARSRRPRSCWPAACCSLARPGPRPPPGRSCSAWRRCWQAPDGSRHSARPALRALVTAVHLVHPLMLADASGFNPNDAKVAHTRLGGWLHRRVQLVCIYWLSFCGFAIQQDGRPAQRGSPR